MPMPLPLIDNDMFRWSTSAWSRGTPATWWRGSQWTDGTFMLTYTSRAHNEPSGQSFHNLAVLVGAFNNEKAFSVIVKYSLRFVASSIMNGGCQTKNPCENVKIFNSGFYVRVLKLWCQSCRSFYLILDGVLFSKISKYIKIFRI